MAILAEIRKQTWLLIVVIGIAMVAFLAGDLFSENSVLKRAFTGDPNEIGSVNGNSITLGEYVNAQNRLSSQGASINQVSQQVWNALVSQKLIKERAESAGITASDEEVWNFMAQRYGMTSGEELKTQVGMIKTQAQQGASGAAEAYQNFLADFENARPELLYQKYLDLVMMGVAVTNEEAKLQQIGNIQNANIEYAFISYDDLKKKYNVKVTDDEINAYVKKYPKKYEKQAMVDLSYVYFAAQPSKADEDATLAGINKFLSKSVNVDQVNNITDTIEAFSSAINDSVYVTKHSDRPFMSQYVTKKQIEAATQLPQEYRDFLLSGQVGQVGGPFKTGNAYQLIKVSKTKAISDSISSSHILISYAGSQIAQNNPSITRTREQAKVLADSIFNMAKSTPANFTNLVSTYSDDAGSKAKNGSIGWTSRNAQNIEPQYLQSIVEAPKGNISLAESKVGFHIIRVDEIKTEPGYLIANIFKDIKPSQGTSDKNHSDAIKFAQDVTGKSLNEFANIAQKRNFNYNTADNVERYSPMPILDPASGISNEKDDEILKWAFSKKTEVGNSFLFTTSNEDQIIVYLSAKTPKGLASAKSVRAEIEPIILQQKLADEVNKKLGANPSVDAFVSNFGAQKGTSNTTFGSAQLIGKGQEPKVAGAAFGLKPNSTSKAIAGKAGVYIVKTISVDAAPKVEDATFLVDQLNNTQSQKVGQQLLPSMIGAANIEDFRVERLDR
ncbi:peptidylprolyl isomerase [Moheibacter sediminis]|uniref:Periplasmic chaperone PpiD n=1 Tax=Moheibacter sediminis TaxID=1434700 RepID=A0A1W2CAS6_9FLAO|nr:peptidylprolyl isomerase [Moheibacter sediminis]SMC82303.1 peptidyl-prolyl cis-trans isomerase D [Moheibacter sediminis]